MSVTDDQLLAALERPEEDAAAELVERFAVPLVRYFQVSLPDSSLAEDAAQEVFCRLISMVRRGKTEKVRSLNALVFTIARRLAIDIQRSWKRRPRGVSLDEPISDEGSSTATLADMISSDAAGPRNEASLNEEMDHVARALRELDDTTSQIIVLRHVEGLSSQEVAEILGIAEGTVWSRLHRGLKSLRGKLAHLEETVLKDIM